jgi:hypothetical protein
MVFELLRLPFEGAGFTNWERCAKKVSVRGTSERVEARNYSVKS